MNVDNASNCFDKILVYSPRIAKDGPLPSGLWQSSTGRVGNCSLIYIQ